MRRLLFLAVVGALVAARRRRFDHHDRQHGFGAYAPVKPRAAAGDEPV